MACGGSVMKAIVALGLCLSMVADARKVSHGAGELQNDVEVVDVTADGQVAGHEAGVSAQVNEKDQQTTLERSVEWELSQTHKREQNIAGRTRNSSSRMSVGDLQPCASERCKVVVVVDMQEDYCRPDECPERGSDPVLGTESAYGKSPFVTPGMKEAAEIIKSVIKKVSPNAVVYTLDWLDTEKFNPAWYGAGQKPFLIRDTFGAKVIKSIRGSENEWSSIAFEYHKDTDDWMTHSDFGENLHYALAAHTFGTQFSTCGGISEQAHMTLPNLLKCKGYVPEKTDLIVTGIAANRCVFKGVMHARELGYSVTLVTDAVVPNAQSPDEFLVSDRWKPTSCKEWNNNVACTKDNITKFAAEAKGLQGYAPKPTCEETFNVEGQCSPETKDIFWSMFYTGRKGGPDFASLASYSRPQVSQSSQPRRSSPSLAQAGMLLTMGSGRRSRRFDLHRVMHVAACCDMS